MQQFLMANVITRDRKTRPQDVPNGLINAK